MFAGKKQNNQSMLRVQRYGNIFPPEQSRGSTRKQNIKSEKLNKPTINKYRPATTVSNKENNEGESISNNIKPGNDSYSINTSEVILGKMKQEFVTFMCI